MDFEQKFFNPMYAGGKRLKSGEVSFRAGRAPVELYLYKPKSILAINVALATKRPLLISGEPGSGKSTLAANVAAVLGRWYYQQTITSRTQASDLLWTFDTLRRLNDANSKDDASFQPNPHYVDPGKLWWAFDPESAAQRGSTVKIEDKFRAVDPGIKPKKPHGANASVVLLDEIDKADPDVPNDMLEPLDILAFTVRETNYRVTSKRDVLLILTTNGERELPPAVLRRCVTLTLDPPNEDWFKRIADTKFGRKTDGLHGAVAEEIVKLRKQADRKGLREPSTAEYLDALLACRELNMTPRSQSWEDFVKTVLWKHEQPPEATAGTDSTGSG